MRLIERAVPSTVFVVYCFNAPISLYFYFFCAYVSNKSRESTYTLGGYAIIITFAYFTVIITFAYKY